MRAIEIESKTDNTGHLKIECQLDSSNQKVRVIILLEELSNSCDENLWMNTISKNPAFNFLNDPKEDIYSIQDGESLND